MLMGCSVGLKGCAFLDGERDRVIMMPGYTVLYINV